MFIEVREITAGQDGSLIDLFNAAFPGFSDGLSGDHAAPIAFLSDPASFLFGAYVGGIPAGLAWGVQIRYPSGRLVTYLHELDVREEFRRRGIATSLVQHAMTHARSRGSTRFWLSTGGHNEIAQSLYDSLGGVRKPFGDVNYWWELA